MNLAMPRLEQPKAWMGAKKISLLPLKYLVLLLVASAGLSWGQSVPLTGIAHAAFRVTDVAKTSNFYQRLGFEQAFAFSKDGKISQAFIKINDRQFLELYSRDTKHSTVGFMHLCFEASDLVKLNAAYRQRGLMPTEVKKAHAGNLLFTLAGPELQNIEYTQYLPGSLHSEDRSKHLGKHRISKLLLTVDVAMQDPAAAEAFYTDKLSFHPISSDDKNSLLLPGTSGESVQLKPADDHSLPDLTFQVANIRRTAKELTSRGFAVRVAAGSVYVTDPDGTMIEFTSGRSVADIEREAGIVVVRGVGRSLERERQAAGPVGETGPLPSANPCVHHGVDAG